MWCVVANGLTCFEQTSDHMRAICKCPDQHAMNIKAKYMVACDGSKSSVRKLLYIGVPGFSSEEPWLIIDLKFTQNRSIHTEAFCDLASPRITLPGPRGRRYYEFELQKGEDY